MRLRKSGALSGHSPLESEYHFILLYKVQPLYHILPYKCFPQSCTASGTQVMLNVRNEPWKGETTCQRSPGFLRQEWDESQAFWLPASCYSGHNRLLDYIFTYELSLGNEISLVCVIKQTTATPSPVTPGYVFTWRWEAARPCEQCDMSLLPSPPGLRSMSQASICAVWC